MNLAAVERDVDPWVRWQPYLEEFYEGEGQKPVELPVIGYSQKDSLGSSEPQFYRELMSVHAPVSKNRVVAVDSELEQMVEGLHASAVITGTNPLVLY